MPKVYIVGGNGGGYGEMFRAAGWDFARGPLSADLIQFTGGEDVTPQLFGEDKHPYTGCNFERDLYEAGYFAVAQRTGIPMAGICRGGQFLNVMSGGRMYQHVDKHATGKGHELQDLATGRTIHVSSTHHQMMIPAQAGIVVASANLGGIKEWVSEDRIVQIKADPVDVEVVYYADTKALCFQPHPEFFNPGDECFDYYFELLERVHGLKV